MRHRITQILSDKGLDYFSLPLSARLLLVTDGTVTELLEAMIKEPLNIGYKSQKELNSENISEPPYLSRKITLQGENTGKHWLYAQSSIFHKNLNQQARAMLLDQTIPMGRILNLSAADNHRKIIDCGYAPNPSATEFFSVEKDYIFLFRKYHILTSSTLLMSIAEWFPLHLITQVIKHKC